MPGRTASGPASNPDVRFFLFMGLPCGVDFSCESAGQARQMTIHRICGDSYLHYIYRCQSLILHSRLLQVLAVVRSSASQVTQEPRGNNEEETQGSTTSSLSSMHPLDRTSKLVV